MNNKFVSHRLIAFFFFILQLSATSMAKEEEEKSLTFEEAWPILQETFNNLTSMAEGSTSYKVTSDAYMSYYTIVYNTCTANPDASSQFYIAYKTSFEDYISSKIMPSLQQAKKEDLVASLVKSWSNFKLVTFWFFRFLNYLDRRYISKNHLPSLEQTSYLCFYDKIFGEMNDEIKDAVLAMIRHEKMGNKIDEKLLNDVQLIYKEMGKSSVEHAHYTKEFEEAMASSFLEEKNPGQDDYFLRL